MDISDAMVDAAARKIGEVFYGGEGELNDLTASQWITLRSAARLSLTAAIGAGGQAVAVKPLEWRAGDEDGWWSALPMTGLPYEVRRTGRGNVRVRVPDKGGWCPFDGTVTEAKAAAQKNYEHRILSALSQPHPADERVVEALREAKNLLWRLQSVIEVDLDPSIRRRIADFDAFVDALSAKEGR